ncbi:MAG: hypothetical protein J6T10_26945 [Methanobrevibacter sp.]|nr:hypothetical protein [Methanobrevibacter sp.]
MDYSGLIGGITGVAGNLLNYGLQDNINDENIANQWQMFRENQRYQNDQNLKMYSTLRKSLEGAGLNINSAFGGYPTTTAPSSSMATKVSPQIDTVGIAQLLQQAPLVKAQARKDNADAESQEIENQRKRSEDNAIKYYDILEAYNNATDEKQKEQYINQLQEVDVVPHNKGWFDSRKAWRQFQTEVEELSARDFKAKLDKLVWSGQYDNQEVVSALQNIPLADYNKVCEDIKNLIKDREVMESVKALNDQKTSESKANEEMIKFQKKLAEQSNIFEMIHKYLGDGAMADAAAFFVFIVSAMTGSINVGFSHKF